MKYIDEFRNPDLAKALVERIHRLSKKPIRLMEFCGGHTHAILRYGIRNLLPPTIEMLSGPGCPVCVTSNADLDKAIAFAEKEGIILATFGDMMKVPGSYKSLADAKAEGADVRIVYSTMDALEIAKRNRRKSVVFLGIGFETTAPTIAASMLDAAEEGIENFYVLAFLKLTPQVTRALLDLGEVKLDGIIGPGHVSTVIGSRAWESIPKDYHIPCVICGFEPLDILQGIEMLVAQTEGGEAKVEIAYRRSVRPEGNKRALDIMYRVFEISPANWRGIGVVPGSGLKIRDEYAIFDAEKAFAVDPGPTREHKGCICGEILRGVKTPLDCKLFRRVCDPESPIGPCMVSSEGACSAYYNWQATP